MRSQVRGEGDGPARADGPYYQQRVAANLGDDGAIGLGDNSVVAEKGGPFPGGSADNRVIGHLDGWCQPLRNFYPIVVIEHVHRAERLQADSFRIGPSRQSR